MSNDGYDPFAEQFNRAQGKLDYAQALNARATQAPPSKIADEIFVASGMYAPKKTVAALEAALEQFYQNGF